MTPLNKALAMISEVLDLQSDKLMQHTLQLKQLEETIAAQGAIINVLTEGRNEQENTDLG